MRIRAPLPTDEKSCSKVFQFIIVKNSGLLLLLLHLESALSFPISTHPLPPLNTVNDGEAGEQRNFRRGERRYGPRFPPCSFFSLYLFSFFLLLPPLHLSLFIFFGLFFGGFAIINPENGRCTGCSASLRIDRILLSWCSRRWRRTLIWSTFWVGRRVDSLLRVVNFTCLLEIHREVSIGEDHCFSIVNINAL